VPLLEQVLERYPEEIKLVFKNFPIKSHEYAMKAAKAALAAHQQGRFWDFHDQLFMNPDYLNDPKIIQTARELGLDMKKFEKALKDPEIQLRINQDIMQGLNIGVKGVPTVFVNTRLLNERSLEGFEDLIESELKRRNEAF
jgi:protein-disulfide isomerase